MGRAQIAHKKDISEMKLLMRHDGCLRLRLWSSVRRRRVLHWVIMRRENHECCSEFVGGQVSNEIASVVFPCEGGKGREG